MRREVGESGENFTERVFEAGDSRDRIKVPTNMVGGLAEESTADANTDANMAASVKQEFLAQLHRGVPVSLSALLRRCLDVMSVAVIGRLGSTAMAAGALATSTTNAVALSVFVGLSSATTTLVSQAVGAGDREQAGLWLHRALIVHAACAVPLTVLLTLLTPGLRALGFAEELAADAGTYCVLLLPGLWTWAVIWTLTPWLQAHGIVRPQLYASVVVAVMHPLWLYLFVSVAGLGLFGAALSSTLSLFTNLIILSITTLTCLRSSVPLLRPRRTSAARLGTFLRLALPGVGMMGEWWASEIAILVSGLLPSPTVALSALSVYQTVNALCFMLPLGSSVAGATRVGAALGSGDGAAARRAGCVCVALGITFSTTLSLLLLSNRHAVAAIFTTDPEVRRAIWQQLLPPLSMYIIADASQVCCGGVLQGCGRQRDGFPLVMASYYLVGLPLACALSFGGHLGVRGMVIGMLTGKLCHALAFGVLVMRMDWPKQVRDAAERVRSERSAIDTAAEPAAGTGTGTRTAQHTETALDEAGNVRTTVPGATAELEAAPVDGGGEAQPSKSGGAARGRAFGKRALQYATLEEE